MVHEEYNRANTEQIGSLSTESMQRRTISCTTRMFGEIKLFLISLKYNCMFIKITKPRPQNLQDLGLCVNETF